MLSLSIRSALSPLFQSSTPVRICVQPVLQHISAHARAMPLTHAEHMCASCNFKLAIILFALLPVPVP